MMRDAESLRRARVSPTEEQRGKIADEIWRFVKKRSRKVYGGHALNAALLDAAPSDAIYPASASASEFTVASSGSGGGDIEFYSPNPVADVYELCDRLVSAGHRFVQGREAAHHGTFTISVEFVRVCDVTYVPTSVYDRVPTRVRDGLITVAPEFALIDHLRILCDPFTSHWKIDRMLPRMLMMQRTFPAVLPSAEVPDVPDVQDEDDPRVRAIESLLSRWASARRDSVAVVGEHAAAFFKDACKASQMCLTAGTRLSLVSTNYAVDLASLASTLGVVVHEDAEEEEDVYVQGEDGEEYFCGDALPATRLAPSATLREYYPMTDLVGSRAEFRVHGQGNGDVLVTLIDAHGKTVPVCSRCPRTGASVASASYCLMTALALRFAASFESETKVASAILGARSRFLEAAGKTVCDRDTVFRDVGLDYIGEPLTDMRVHMEAADQRRIVGGPNAQVWFSYDPLRPGRHNHGKSRAARYQLMRCDGQEIVDEVDSVLCMHVDRLRVEAKMRLLESGRGRST